MLAVLMRRQFNHFAPHPLCCAGVACRHTFVDQGELCSNPVEVVNFIQRFCNAPHIKAAISMDDTVPQSIIFLQNPLFFRSDDAFSQQLFYVGVIISNQVCGE